MSNPSQQLSKALSEGPKIRDLIQMHDGELNLEVPQEVSLATIDALINGHTGYCNLTGIDVLKNALIERCFQQHSKLCDPAEILVSNGSSQALFMLMKCILSNADEVLIPNPCWPAYRSYIELNGGIAVDYEMGNRGLDIVEIRKLVTLKTKALIINSPHNPTGLILSRQDILVLVALSQEYGFLLISDEAYEGIIFGSGEYVSPLDLMVDSSLLVVTRTFSKLFSMSGFRIGYMFADRKIIDRCSTLQGVMTDNACTFAQHGALAAIALPKSILKKRVDELQHRAYYCHQLLSTTFDIVRPQGGFFLFPDISRVLGATWNSDTQFVDDLLNVKSVSTTPGSSYGMKDHIRISIASVNEAKVTDVLITGGDPLVMKTSNLRAYLEPLLTPEFEHIHTIRIGTKALSFWPQRFVTDSDAGELLDLFRKIINSGKHLALMAHYNHWAELEPAIAREAILRVRQTGAQIRSQGPLLAHINDSADVWARLWQTQIQLGIIPYYMFIERDTGARRYFEVPLVGAWEIYRDAVKQVSGIARTARGPSMSADPGKVEVCGVAEIRGEKVFVLSFIQARNPDWVQRPFFARFDPDATWFDQLKPAFGETAFFFEREVS